jgi:hypothetical protein
MNNTKKTKKTLVIVAVLIAAALVVGSFATTTTISTQSASAAYGLNKGVRAEQGNGNDGNSKNGNTLTIQKCKQAATQSGWDNDQEQECENTICTHPGENSTCVQEGGAAAVVTPTSPAPQNVMACVECFTSSLSQAQIGSLLAIFNLTSLEDLCAALENGTISAADLSRALVLQVVPTISDATLFDLRECITAATGIELPHV